MDVLTWAVQLCVCGHGCVNLGCTAVCLRAWMCYPRLYNCVSAGVDVLTWAVQLCVCWHGCVNLGCTTVCLRALQFPPEAWLRISLAHTSLTHLMIRPSGRVILKSLGNSGHLPPLKVSYSWLLWTVGAKHSHGENWIVVFWTSRWNGVG